MTIQRLPGHVEYIYCCVSEDGENTSGPDIIFFLRLNEDARTRLLQFKTVWEAARDAAKAMVKVGEDQLYCIELFDCSIEAEFAHRHLEVLRELAAYNDWVYTNTKRKPRGTSSENPRMSYCTMQVREDGVRWVWAEKHGGEYTTPILLYSDLEHR